MSVHVPFRRQSAGRGRELNLVGTSRDNALAQRDAGANADEVSVAGCDLDETAGEAFPARLDEHVRTAGLGQHRGLRHGRHPLARARVEDGDCRLADEELPVAVVHVELNGKCVCRGIEHARVMHVVGLDENGIRASGNLERDVGDFAGERRIGGRHVRLQLYAIRPDDSEERRAFVVRRPERRVYFRKTAGDGCPEDK